MDRELTPLGRMLEEAREAIGISGREAARRATITDTRWRQVVSGIQARGDKTSPARPRPQTVVAMALAVDVDPAAALKAAGMDDDPKRVVALIGELDRIPPPAAADALAAEIEAIAAMSGVPRAVKLRMIAAAREAWEKGD